jgi:hypothetical protein
VRVRQPVVRARSEVVAQPGKDKHARGGASTEHLARAASTHQQPADRQEPESADREEHPVVEGNVDGQVPHVVQVEQVVINHAFGEIESTPSE